MNEYELKQKFIDFLETNSNHNFFGNNGITPNKIIEIRNEALNRKFDLILAVNKIKNLNIDKIKNKTIELDDDIKNIFTRNRLLQTISRKYKIKIQNIVIYPIEIKSDKDNLDERLANQIVEAILTFGRSVVIFDNNHSLKILKNGLNKILPSTLIGYKNLEKKFFLINKYNKVFSDSLLNINKINLIKTLESSDANINYNNLYKNLKKIQQINQKLIYNQIFNNEHVLFEEEIKFIEKFSTLHPKISFKQEIIKSIKEHKNYKLTDFID